MFSERTRLNVPIQATSINLNAATKTRAQSQNPVSQGTEITRDIKHANDTLSIINTMLQVI